MYKILHINLTAPKGDLEKRIKARVASRGLDTSFEKTEINIMKKQLVWFNKYAGIKFDVSQNNWSVEAKKTVWQWYNKS